MKRTHNPARTMAMGRSVPCTALALSLAWSALGADVAHWPMDDASGWVASDAIAAHDASLRNGASFTTGRVDGGLSLNGISAYAFAPSHPDFQMTNALTVAAWVKGDAWGSGNDVDTIISKGDKDPNNWALAIRNAWVTLYLDERDNAGTRGSTKLAPGRWHHVAATWDGAEIRIYVDGALDNVPATRSGTIGTDARHVFIGGLPAGDRFDGVIDDVRLFSHALGEAEIRALAGFSSIARLLMVVRNPGNLTTQEDARRASFEQWGYAVGLIDASDSQAAFDKAVAESDLAYVSEEINAAQLGTKLLDPPIGVVVEDRAAFDVFGLTESSVAASNQSAVTLLEYDHYITVPFTPGALALTTGNEPMNWIDQPVAPGGQILGRWSDGQPALVVVDAGARLIDGSTAPGRRVFLPMGANSFDWDTLTDDGLAVVRRSLEWTRALVAHWKLDEEAGSIAADSVGGHDALVSGGAWEKGALGGARRFGSGTHASVPGDDAFRVTDSLSVAAWIRGDSWGAGANAGTILRKGETGPNNWQLAIVNGRVALILDDSEPNGHRGDTLLETGRWYHAAATWDGQEVRIYLNGALDAPPSSRPGTIGTDERDVYLGGHPASDSFDGLLDDVRFGTLPMGADEVLSLFRMRANPRIVRWEEIGPAESP